MLGKKYCLAATILVIIVGVGLTSGLAATQEKITSLYFESNAGKLRADSLQELKQVIAELKANPDWRLMIEGHTDDSGDSAANHRLSLDRAQAVRDLIVAGGIDKGRLVVQGYGETRPLSDNTTPEGRARNRRVDLSKVLSQTPQAVVPESHFEFESVVEGREVVHAFQIQNRGQAPLVIEKVKTG